MFAVKS